MIRQRLLTAFVLGGAFLGALFLLGDLYWALFLLFFIVVAAMEWASLHAYSRSGRLLFPGLVLVCGLLMLPEMPALFTLQASLGVVLVTGATLFWLLVAPLWLKRRWQKVASGASAVVGVLLLLTPWLALVHLRQLAGPFFVLAVMATVWLADSAAYFCGKRFGRNKLAPQISPGKTWEGVYGALLAVCIFAVGVCALLNLSLWYVPGFLIVAVWSVIGDLFESLIKRQAGQKDSGALFPGHGGVLDRIDGLTAALPLVACLMLVPYYLNVLIS